MNKLLILPCICIISFGCNKEEEFSPGEVGKMDARGIITEVDRHNNRILIEETDFDLIWITLNNYTSIDRYEIGQEVAVWIDGVIAESAPAQGNALNIEIIGE